jgi:hypothetical protein
MPGTFGQGKGAWECDPCHANTFSNDTAATSVTNCKACPLGRTTGEGTGKQFIDACLCDRFVTYQNTSGFCIKCPEGADCSKFDGITEYEMFPLAGYWRPYANSTDFASCASVYPGTNADELAKSRCCPIDQNGGSKSRCDLNIRTRSRQLEIHNDTTQWNPNHQCVTGYVGPLCMSCDEKNGYLLSTTKFCEICEDGNADVVGAAMMLVGASILLCLVVFIVLSR